MKKDNEIDRLFKTGMEDPDIPFNELDWQKMEKKLDASATRKRSKVWIYAVTGIAASILLVLFLFLNDQNTWKAKQSTNSSAKSKGKHVDQLPSSSKESRSLNEEQDVSAAAPGVYAREGKPASKELDNAPDPVLDANAKIPMLTGVVQTRIDNKVLVPAKLNSTGPVLTLRNETNAPALETLSNRPEVKQGNRSGKLTLSVLAAPDVTDSRTSIGTKISSNFGFLLTYPISKKLSVSSGAIYARKLYDYGGTIGSSAYGEAGKPWELNADCFVIDVPVNLNFQVLNKKKYAVSVNTGLSSYFMLKEKYVYTNTNQDGVQERSALEINNQNQHIFGIANFSLSFDRKVSENVSIGVQPFFKVPLTGIGYYDYNLRSRGVAVSISVKPFGAKK